jgi:hypothetical protein
LKATIVIFNHHWRAKVVGFEAHFSFLFCFKKKCMCCKLVYYGICYVEYLNVFFSYSFRFLLHYSIAGSKLLSRFNIHDVDDNVVCHFGSIFCYNDGGGKFTLKYP